MTLQAVHELLYQSDINTTQEINFNELVFLFKKMGPEPALNNDVLKYTQSKYYQYIANIDTHILLSIDNEEDFSRLEEDFNKGWLFWSNKYAKSPTKYTLPEPINGSYDFYDGEVIAMYKIANYTFVENKKTYRGETTIKFSIFINGEKIAVNGDSLKQAILLALIYENTGTYDRLWKKFEEVDNVIRGVTI